MTGDKANRNRKLQLRLQQQFQHETKKALHPYDGLFPAPPYCMVLPTDKAFCPFF